MSSAARSPRPACLRCTIYPSRSIPARARALPRSSTARRSTRCGDRLGALHEALDDLRHVMTLKAREVELLLRGKPRAVGRRDRAGAVGRAALELADIGE